jgi:hypothetical protein
MAVFGAKAEEFIAKADNGTGMSGLGAKQTCREGGTDGKG